MQDAIATGSTERFGYEWHRYSEILPEYEEQFRRWLPFYSPQDWIGKRFLDVGCGMGRNSYWPMSYGAAEGVAVDLDARSVAAARANLARFPDQCRVASESAYSLPWTGEFDIAFSIGVIHHLENPLLALKNMANAVKPDGQVAIWVYGRENMGWLLWLLEPSRKYIFSHLPIMIVHALAIVPTAALWLALRAGLGRIEYFRLISKFSFAHLRSIVFDQMLPKIANYWSGEDVETLLREAGLTRIEVVQVNQMSWAARGWK